MAYGSTDGEGRVTPRTTTSTSSSRSSSTLRRCVVLGVAAFVVASVVATRARTSGRVLGGPNEFNREHAEVVTFTLDASCVPTRITGDEQYASFFSSDVVRAVVLTKERAGEELALGDGTEMTRGARAGTYVVTRMTASRAEYGFALTNANGETIYELRRNARFPRKGSLIDKACATTIHIGGGVYENRKLPFFAEMTPKSDGSFAVSHTFAGCEESCLPGQTAPESSSPASPPPGSSSPGSPPPGSSSSPASPPPRSPPPSPPALFTGSASKCRLFITTRASWSTSNLFSVEEGKATLTSWTAHTGNWKTVSPGIDTTWALQTKVVGGYTLMSSPTSTIIGTSARWQMVDSPDPKFGVTFFGPIIDLDSGYNAVYAIGKSNSVWRRQLWPIVNQIWKPAGIPPNELVANHATSMLQIAGGRTRVWGIQGAVIARIGPVFYCPEPCVQNTNYLSATANMWKKSTTPVLYVKHIEVGEKDVFIVGADGKSVYRNSEDGADGWTGVAFPKNMGTSVIQQIAVGFDALWLLATDGKLHVCALPCAGGAAFSVVSKAPANIISIDASKRTYVP